MAGLNTIGKGLEEILAEGDGAAGKLIKARDQIQAVINEQVVLDKISNITPEELIGKQIAAIAKLNIAALSSEVGEVTNG